MCWCANGGCASGKGQLCIRTAFGKKVKVKRRRSAETHGLKAQFSIAGQFQIILGTDLLVRSGNTAVHRAPTCTFYPASQRCSACLQSNHVKLPLSQSGYGPGRGPGTWDCINRGVPQTQSNARKATGMMEDLTYRTILILI